MHCKRCEYPLWNLLARTCPECGAPFAPSEFEFVADSVRFCCPACSQDYYGTDERGHLVPREFDCVRCGRHLRMDDMLLLPTEGVAEEQTKVDIVPWLDRGRLGFLRGWFGTLGMALTGPRRLAKSIPSESRTGAALWFAILTACVYGAVGGLVILPFIVGASLTRGGLADIAVMLVCVPTAIVVAIGAWALVSHFLLVITGGVGQGLLRTFICVCYSVGACVLVAVPCVGFYLSPLAWVWMAISLGFMLSVTHRASTVRGMLAAFTPPVVVLAGLVAWTLIVVVPPLRAGLAMSGPMMVQMRAQMAMPQISNALSMYTAMNGGVAPPHGAALLADGSLSVQEFFLNGWPQTPGEGVIAGIDITKIAGLPPEQRAGAISVLAASLPADVVAHRVGDMVFTYHGIDLSGRSTVDPSLWLVVCAPLAPSAPAAGVPPMPYYVCTFAGGMVTINPGQMKTALEKQNELRAAAGLAALPDPTSVVQAPSGEKADPVAVPQVPR